MGNTAIQKAKEIAIADFKKTYHYPQYSHPKYILVGALYIAGILVGDRRTMAEITEVSGISGASIRNYYRKIADELNIDIIL